MAQGKLPPSLFSLSSSNQLHSLPLCSMLVLKSVSDESYSLPQFCDVCPGNKRFPDKAHLESLSLFLLARSMVDSVLTFSFQSSQHTLSTGHDIERHLPGCGEECRAVRSRVPAIVLSCLDCSGPAGPFLRSVFSI